MKVAVIGGGWAGIAAAVELTAAGLDTTLFEAGRALGGRARSVDIAGRTLDNGQHILLGAYRETLALMRQVGADPGRLLDRRPLNVVDASGFRLALPRLPAPLNVAWGLLAARHVGLREKLATARWMHGVKARGFVLPADTTVAAWLDGAGQAGVLRRRLWEPLCLAALNTPAERASAQIFANVLRDSLGSPCREDTDLLLPRAPLGELLPEPAADWLLAYGTTLRTGTRVRALDTRPDTIAVDGEDFAAAVLATAPQHVAQLWPGAVPVLEHEPIATVYLQFRPETTLPFPLLSQAGKCGQWVVDRGKGLLACVLSGRGDWEAFADDDLAALLAAELALPSPVLWHTVVRERRATFSCRPGLPRAGCTTASPRLFLAGDHTWADYPGTLEGAVRSGRRAAHAVIACGDNRRP